MSMWRAWGPAWGGSSWTWANSTSQVHDGTNGVLKTGGFARYVLLEGVTRHAGKEFLGFLSGPERLPMGKDHRIDPLAAADAPPFVDSGYDFPLGDHEASAPVAPVKARFLHRLSQRHVNTSELSASHQLAQITPFASWSSPYAAFRCSSRWPLMAVSTTRALGLHRSMFRRTTATFSGSAVFSFVSTTTRARRRFTSPGK